MLDKVPDSLLDVELKTINGQSIRGDGNIVVEGGGGGEPVDIEDKPIQYHRHSFTTDGTSATYTTPFELDADGLLVFVSSTYQAPDTYTVDGNSITFNELPEVDIHVDLIIGNGFGNTVNIPEEFGVPYSTNEKFGGRTVWAVRIDCGLTAASKTIQVPTIIVNEWDGDFDYFPPRIDLSESYAIDGGLMSTLPHLASSGSGNNVSMSRLDPETGEFLSWTSHEGHQGWPHVAVIKYIKKES